MVKNHKHRVAIAVVILSILLLFSALSVFSFEFFPRLTTPYVSSSAPASLDVIQHLLAVYSYQVEMGFLDNYDFVLLSYDPDTHGVQLFSCPDADSVTFSQTNWSLTINSSNQVYRYLWNSSSGWYYNTRYSSLTVYAQYVYVSSLEIPSSSYYPAFTGPNPNAVYGSDLFNAGNVYSYYDYIYKSSVERLERESELESEAFSEGYSDGYSDRDSLVSDEVESAYRSGFDTGFDYGHQFGFQDGYESGVSDGYNVGFIDGDNEGYNRGFSHGFSDGYVTGWEEGSAAQAEAWPPSSGETVTEIVYRDAVDLDLPDLISSIASIPKSIIYGSFDLNIFGISIAGILSTLIVAVIVIYFIKRVK